MTTPFINILIDILFGQMKARAENLDADMDLLKAAFSEISRLSAEVAIENISTAAPGTKDISVPSK